ncbi:(R)-benzylsuccinyl-CoA dehydrogenase [Paraburkholderia aspalathi]|uniref:acyl-CoA dehydrogenase family protein n=1 Tax=Paraburkholderia aspalathi TaxID=1324617 RepID=UPI00190C0C71|nr:acyl-CoA dehydrogenase family protein [Paraburkholderia aspalathi]MBK3842078.1 acyl-CoA dehydrogenase [Paraburkholderia aspalathi]CAE6820067.1 (R)-benzylsuccinyl-CoA dehydrogenase [Paraburkholderia aspalathi]
MDFSIDSSTRELRDRVRAFVDNVLLPLETKRESYDEHENIAEGLLAELRAHAREQGLWALQMPRERGGGGLSIVQMAVCYEEMNRSIFGPVVFNSAAPDDGNMILLNKVATQGQKDRWMQPIIDGKVRSAFAMTEPAPGAGSDPSMMLTTAERIGDKWIIRGRKWFITGGEAAKHWIVIARTSADARKGLTAFLFHADDPGWRVVRRIPIMGPEEHGGHCEIEFDGLEIPDEQRLMEVGDGLKATQIRLGTARLTHCMRWNGMARRAMELAVSHVGSRKAGGHVLSEREGVQWMLGEAAMKLDVARLLTMRAAWHLDQGDFARPEISMAKIAASETLHQVIDTAIQLHGAKGYSKDTLLEWMYRYARQARLVDGASEVHKMVVARSLLERGNDAWDWKELSPAVPPAAKE